MPHFIVTGGGIAGLTTAIALGRQDHRVQVLERREAFEEAGAGLQMSPNATRIAHDLGLLGDLRKVGIVLEGLHIRRGRDGARIATLPLGAAADRRYPAPFLVVHRADLHAVLVEAAQSLPGFRLALSTTVTRTDPLSGTVESTGPAGPDRCSADGIIRADGLTASRAGTHAGPAYSGKTAWRALIPAHALPGAATAAFSNLWLGERAHAVHYPVRGGSLVNLVIIVDEDLDRSAGTRDLWAESGDPTYLLDRLRDWNGEVRRLVEAAPSWRKWPLFDGTAGSVRSSGCETRVGDAAHPMLPFLAQGASQAFEDATALADAVSVSGSQIAAAFRRYELGRAARTARVQAASRRQGRIYHLAGVAAQARDFVMAVLGPERLLARLDWLYAAGGGSLPTPH